MTVENSHIDKSRLIGGGIILVIGFLSPLFIPFVTNSDLSVGLKTTLSGLLAFGIPEIFMLIAIGIMGKQGYEFLKGKAMTFFKQFAPSDQVSLKRYRIGLFMFCIPLLLGVIQPYLAYYFSVIEEFPIWWTIILDLFFVSSFFVLGGDFWDKLSGLFKHDVTVCKESGL